MATIKAGDQVTILDVTDAYSVILTSEAYTFVGGTGGAASGLSCSTDAVAFCGTNQCNTVTVNKDNIVCPDGISASVSGSGTKTVTITFTTTATVANACEATIPVEVDGITVNKRFSFAVAKTGATGAKGDAGKGIRSTTIEYNAHTGNTTVPTDAWSASIPSVPAGQYLWTRTTITYTDDSTSVAYSVAKQGATGTTGSLWYSGTACTGTSTTGAVFATGISNARANDRYLNTTTGNTYKCTTGGNASTAKWAYAGSIKGATGAKGDTGDTGNGIASVAVTYQVSSSGTTTPTGTWQTSIPTVSAGQYLWTRTVFTYTSGDTDTQYSVARSGTNGKAGADAITLNITSSNGTVFKNASGSTVLTAHVYKAGTEQSITDAGVVANSLGTIRWYSGSSTTAVATARTLTVSATDVTNAMVYTCQLEA